MKHAILIGLLSILLSSACSSGSKNAVEMGNTGNPAETVADSENKNVGGQTKILPSADTLSIGLTLLRNGKQMTVGPGESFVKDDGARLNISTVEKGYLYVLYKGSGGDVQVLFPNKDYFNGKNEIEPNKTLVIPNKGWFFFDEKKGTETIFVVYSKMQAPGISAAAAKENLKLLEKRRAEAGNREAFTFGDEDLARVIELRHQ